MPNEPNTPTWGQNAYRNRARRERQARRDAEMEKEAEMRRAREAERAAQYDGLPESYRAFDKLAEAAGHEVAEKVNALVEAMIQEAQPPYEGREP